MTTELAERAVLVTGATGSVGQALVEAFSHEGAIVFAYYHSQVDRARRLAELPRVTCVSQDLTADAWDIPNHIDVLVNNAGINVSSALTADVTDSDWDRTLSVNVTAPFRAIRSALPHMVSQRWGRIINISSIYGLRGTGWNLPYNVSKHGLSALTKTVAKEYARHGITCNEVCPGPIDSDMMDHIASVEAQEEGRSVGQYLEDYFKRIPARRFAKPLEVAATAVFLAGEQAAYINGASIVVDGGWIA